MSLTDEDRQWIAAELKQVEDRLTEHMRDMQTELLKAFLPFREQVGLLP